MKRYLPGAIVIILILSFFGYIIYRDHQGDKMISRSTSQSQQTSQPTEVPAAAADTNTNSDQSSQPNTPMDQAQSKRPQLSKPSMMIDSSKSYQAVMHTDQGDITIDLTSKETPQTVNNFVYLSKNHFYDNTIFHRVIKGFMIQGGDPTGTGRGGPGYQFDDEKFSGTYERGTVAMANAGPNTNGSQFFIMHAKQGLPPNYVIFGQVVDGMDTVDKIAEAQVTMSDSGEQSKPVTPVVVKTVDISEK